MDLRLRHIETEFSFSATRSSGPGGQNVNKVNSRVEVRFVPQASVLLSEHEKSLITARLSNKLTTQGELIVSCQTARSQWANREEAIEKLYLMLEKALVYTRPRIATKPSKGATEKRLIGKKSVSERKAMRRKPEW